MPARHLLQLADVNTITFSADTIAPQLPADRFSIYYGARFKDKILGCAGVGSGRYRSVNLELLSKQAQLVLASGGHPQATLLPPLCCVYLPGHPHLCTPDNGLLYVLRQLQQGQAAPCTLFVDVFTGSEHAQLANACQVSMQASGILEPVLEASLREADQEMPVHGFQGTILRWDTSLLHRNARLLDKVQCLQERYPPGPEGVLQWGRLQFWLTLEEVRRQIAMAFQDGLQEAQWAQVLVDARAARDTEKDKEDGVTNIKICNTQQSIKQQQDLGLKAGSSRTGKKRRQPPLGLKPTDLVLLSCHQASSLDELVGRKPHAMGIVKCLEDDDDGSLALILAVYAPKDSAISRMLGLEGGEDALPMDEMGSSKQQEWYITFLANVATPSRVWDALREAMHAASSRQEKDEIQAFGDDELQELMRIGDVKKSGVSRVLLKVLPANPIDFPLPGPDAIRRSKPDLGGLLDAAARYCRERNLNDSQVHSIEHAVAAAHGKGGVDCSVQLIQGPPGTGKTSAIVALLSVLGGCGRNVLLCAPTNIAIREVALRFKAMLQNNSSRGSAGQFGGSRFWTKGSKLALGDVVLLASEDTVPEESELQQVWSSARARRLLDVIRLQGMRNRGADLMLLLGNTKDLYKRCMDSLDNIGAASSTEPDGLSAAEAIPALQQQRQQQQQQQQGSTQSARKPTLRKWFLESLRACTLDLIKDAEIVENDLPTSLLSPGARQRVASIISSLGQLQDLCGNSTDGDLSVAMDALCAAHQSSEPETPVDLPQVSHRIFELGFPLLHHGVFSNLYEPFLDTISTANEERAVQDLEQIVLATAPICFSTVSSAGRSVMAQARSAAFDRKFEELKTVAKRGFDVCIVDEAGQLIEAELAIVAQGFPLVPAMVLVGDHQQLPATIMSPLARKLKYGRSLLERLYANNIEMRLLDVQHRMVPDISRYPAAAFYNGLLADGPHVGREDRPGLASLSKSQPYRELGSYAIVNLDRGREERLPYSTSWVNYAEVEAVVSVVKAIKTAHDGPGTLSIGVITPYKDQCEQIAERIGVPLSMAAIKKRLAGRDYEERSWHPLEVEVHSVDGFQGREMDVIIFCTVRSNDRGDLGFLGDKRRLNVAITRGRLAMWVIGHLATLEASGKACPDQDDNTPPKEQVWADLIRDANMRGRVFQAEQVTAVREGLNIVAKECKRQGDLKNPAMNMWDGLPWKIAFTDRFDKRLRGLLGPEERPQVLFKILQLGKGQRPKSFVTNDGSDMVADEFRGVVHVTPVFVNKLFIIWSVAIDKAQRCQYLLIQNLSKREGLSDAVKMAQQAVRTHGATYLQKCKEIKPVPGQNIILPVEWPDHVQISWTAIPASASTGKVKPARGKDAPAATGDTGSRPDDTKEQAPQSELIEKYYVMDSISASLLIKSDKSVELDLPLKMSPDEEKATAHTGTIFVQGRSGTGKTTVLINRLLKKQEVYDRIEHEKQQEQQQQQQSHGEQLGGTGQQSHDAGGNGVLGIIQNPQAQGQQLRQLLVTLSPMLCVTMKGKIEHSLQQRRAVMFGKAKSQDQPQQQQQQEQGQQEQMQQEPMHQEQLQQDQQQQQQQQLLQQGPQQQEQQQQQGQQDQQPADQQHADREDLMDDEVVEAKLGELPGALSSVPDSMCPLVLPLETLLKMLDASFPEPFKPYQLLDPLAGKALANEDGNAEDEEGDRDMDCMDEDEQALEEGDADEEVAVEKEGGGTRLSKAAKRRRGKGEIPWTYGGTGVGREVKFELFDDEYWMCFDAKARKIVGSSSAAFTEIVSTLKGSTAAVRNKHATGGKQWLSEEEYLGLSEARGEILSEMQRRAILKIFKQYESKKTERGDWDVMDVVWHIHRRIDNGGGTSTNLFPAAAKFQEIYIDECQDLPQATISLLRYISAPQRAARGFVFAGDSAQTITRGVTFRFKDLREHYIKDFLGSSAQQDSQSRQQAHRDEAKLKMFELTMNFRTTKQVVKLAASIIRLLLFWFENSLDKLPEEEAEDAGPKPIFIEDTTNPLHVLLTGGSSPVAPQNDSNAPSSQPNGNQKVKGSTSGNGHSSREEERHLEQAATFSPEGVHFGAEQAVIVRDDVEKRKLKASLEQYGSAAKGLLVLTVHECKGLEFQNVLIHRFFSTSPQKWRLIYDYMEQKQMLTEQQSSSEFSHPTFNAQEHGLMCSELKQLYVLCTRAKHCVAFYEDAHDTITPMLHLWHAEDAVQHLPLDEVKNYFRSHSNPEDWQRMATTLYANQKYEDAKSCFERAGDNTGAQRSEAMMYRMEARKAKDKKMHKLSREASMHATQLFKFLCLKDHAANEMIFHGDFKQAAEQLVKLEKWQKAVECFLKVRPVPWEKVAITKERIGEIQGALAACLKGIQPMGSAGSINQARPESAATATRKMADLGLSLIQKRMEDTRPQYQRLDPDEAGRLKTQFLERVVRKIFVHSGTDKELGPLVVHYVRQFASIDAQRAFLQKNEMLGALLVLEEETGDWGRAAELKETLGDMRGAADSYFRAGNRVHALRLLLRLLRIELMWSKDQQGHKGTGWPFVNLRAAEVESLIVQVDEQIAALQQSQPQQQEQQTVGPSDHGKLGLLAVEAEVLKAGRAWCSFHLGSSKQRTRSANVPTLGMFRALNSSLDQAVRAAGMALDSISANSEEKIYANYLRLQLLRMGWEEGARECREVVDETEKLDVSLLNHQGIPLGPQQMREQRQRQQAQHQRMADTMVALLQQWDKLRGVLDECAKVARVVGSKGSSSSLDQKSRRLLGTCLWYKAAAQNPLIPSQVQLDCKAPFWLPMTTQFMGRDGTLITLSAFGHAAADYWTSLVKKMYMTLLELGKKALAPLQPSMTSLKQLLDTQTLTFSPTAPSFGSAREALVSSHPGNQAGTAAGSAGGSACTTDGGALPHATRVEACCSLLLAQQAAFKHLQSYQARGNTESQKLQKQSEEKEVALFNVVVTPFMAQILQPLSSLVMQCERKEVSRALQDLASALRSTETPLPTLLKPYSMEWALPNSSRVHTPLLHHSNTWSYETLGKLMLLKDVLPWDFVPSEMLDFPDKKYFQVSPWQLGIMSMRDMQAVLVATTTTQSQSVSPGKVLRIASFAAFHGLRFASRAGNLPGRLVSMLRMQSLDKMLQPTGILAEYRASFLSPFTFITLMERNATVCMAMASELSNLALPASYAVVHASLDGPSKLLTALLKVGFIAPQGRAQHQEALLEAGKVLSDVCRENWIEPWMKATTPMVAEDKTKLDVLVKVFRTRALVLWMVILVNARKDLLARSREGTTLEEVTANLVEVLSSRSLPQKLRAYIIKASLPQGIQARTHPSDDLHSILPSLNDELVLLKRSTQIPSPPWASKLRTYIVAQRKPVQGQAHVRGPARGPAATMFGSAIRAAQGAEYSSEVEFVLPPPLGPRRPTLHPVASDTGSSTSSRVSAPVQQQPVAAARADRDAAAPAMPEREAEGGAEDEGDEKSRVAGGDDEGGSSAEVVAAQNRATQELLDKKPSVKAALREWHRQWVLNKEQQLTPLQQLQREAWQVFFACNPDITICARLASRGTPCLRKKMLRNERERERVKEVVAYVLAYVDRLCPLHAWSDATLPTLYKAKEVLMRHQADGAGLISFIAKVKARHQALTATDGAAGNPNVVAGTPTDGNADAGMDEEAEFDAAENIKEELLDAVLDLGEVLKKTSLLAESMQGLDLNIDLGGLEDRVIHPLSMCQKRCAEGKPELLPSLLSLVESETT